ncbi:MAG: polyprenyl synthetase family protein [Planctomycetota bacterium]
MASSFASKHLELRESIEQALDLHTQIGDGCPKRLREAIRYSVLSPGKRLRPLLALLACKALGQDWKKALPAACAVEFIHVYSLIHDDLPAMDDDDLRRGKPTCHKQFDEATAILAGDSLQMLAIEVLCNQLEPETAARCCQMLAKSAGSRYLVGGQADDLAAEGRFGQNPELGSAEFLKNIHLRKTGALIVVSLQLGGVIGGANDEQIAVLGQFGHCIGLAFQIVDDCLDVEASVEQMGKMTRKDDFSGKLTYPNLLGLTASKQLAQDLIREAQKAVAVFGNEANELTELAEFVGQRNS